MSSEEKLDKLPHCKFYVERKKRFCRISVHEGDEYCPEHKKAIEFSSEDYLKAADGNEDKIRVKCPLDPKHSCYANKLRKHLKICNAREKPREAFIEKGINSGESSSTELEDERYKILSTYSEKEIKATIERVKQIYSEIDGQVSDKFLQHDLVESEMSLPKYGDKKIKHLKQASAILGLLKEYNLLKPDSCFIEFGAGRGQLTCWIIAATENTNCNALLIEKQSPKHKRDNKIAKTTENLVKRIRADISDLVLDKLDIEKEKNIVGVTKHLCGGATDLALRCLGNSKERQGKIAGLVMTFCCHHQCRWTSYTGKELFKEKGLNVADFNIICGMTCWATCGTGYSRDKQRQLSKEDISAIYNLKDEKLGLTKDEKQDIGRKCKHILNWGRLKYLNSLGFDCKLHFYVDQSYTLENVCIVAVKK